MKLTSKTPKTVTPKTPKTVTPKTPKTVTPKTPKTVTPKTPKTVTVVSPVETPVVEVRIDRFKELDRLIELAGDFTKTETPVVSPVSPKTTTPKTTTKSKFQFIGIKNSNGVTCPDPGGWGSLERPYSSFQSLVNDSRVYNRTIQKYREINLGVPGPWIEMSPVSPVVETPVVSQVETPVLVTV